MGDTDDEEENDLDVFCMLHYISIQRGAHRAHFNALDYIKHQSTFQSVSTPERCGPIYCHAHIFIVLNWHNSSLIQPPPRDDGDEEDVDVMIISIDRANQQ